jgi:hypothetical protein
MVEREFGASRRRRYFDTLRRTIFRTTLPSRRLFFKCEASFSGKFLSTYQRALAGDYMRWSPEATTPKFVHEFLLGRLDFRPVASHASPSEAKRIPIKAQFD